MHLLRTTSSIGLVIFAGLLAFAPSLESSDGLPWRLSTVDSSGIGEYDAQDISLAFVPDGHPAIAYHDAMTQSSRRVRFAHFDGLNWSAVTIDSTEHDRNRPALAFDGSGQPAIAYDRHSDVRLARFAGGNWNTVTIDGFTGYEPSLAFGLDGQPAIACYDLTDTDYFTYFKYALRFARFNGTSWSVATIDPDFGGRPSVAFAPDGQPAISYVGDDGLLRLARFTGNTLSVIVVAATTDSFSLAFSSLAFGPDGHPAIAFGSYGDLRIARYNGNAWIIATVDQGDAPSLAFGPDGQPAIAYGGVSGLRFAHFDGANWNVSIIDPVAAGNASLTFGPDGQPAIGYRRRTNFGSNNFDGSIRFAQRYIPPSIPAELVGPAGPGATTYTGGDDAITYRINFEHLPTATAPAQVVDARFQVAPQLDLATLEFVSVGFGDELVNVPPGLQKFGHIVQMSTAGVTFEARIRLGIFDESEGELGAFIESTMPATGQRPPAHVGFLPPEDQTGRGQGHVSFTIRPKAGLPTGTEIRSTGFVFFDPYPLAGEPKFFRTDLSIPTDPKSPPDPGRQTLVILDAEPPSSRVLPLVWLMGGRSFAVTWEGSDSATTATTFDIYVRTDNGAWTLWQDNTSATTAVWSGEFGRDYAFVSIARDGVGNVEGVVTATTPPDAQTRVAATPGRLLNLSTRARCGTGPDVTISGFVISGTATKRLLIRAVGPTLADFHVSNVLLNPEMTLRERITEVLHEDRGANDNWSTNANSVELAAATTALGAFALAPTSGDAALLVDLAPGVYTVVAQGVAGTSGMVLVEIYDGDDTLNTTQAVGAASAGSQLINISTRGYSGTGDEVLIPGFVISPEGAQTLLLRVVGPTLGNFGVAGAMVDPKLTIFNRNAVVVENDNWSERPDAANTVTIAERVGAFPLVSGAGDAALVVTLPPGQYTMLCGSADGVGTGVVLAEVFLVQ